MNRVIGASSKETLPRLHIAVESTCLQQHPKIIWLKMYPKSPTMFLDYLFTNIKMVGTNICKISQNLTNIFLYIIYQGNIPWLHSLLNLIPSTAAVPQLCHSILNCFLFANFGWDHPTGMPKVWEECGFDLTLP